jgi:hypothetical protein
LRISVWLRWRSEILTPAATGIITALQNIQHREGGARSTITQAVARRCAVADPLQRHENAAQFSSGNNDHRRETDPIYFRREWAPGRELVHHLA